MLHKPCSLRETVTDRSNTGAVIASKRRYLSRCRGEALMHKKFQTNLSVSFQQSFQYFELKQSEQRFSIRL